MDGIKFEWDPNKNEVNKKKHKISFEEAQTVFYDENALAWRYQFEPALNGEISVSFGLSSLKGTKPSCILRTKIY